ncbi:MAG: hypothetical protein WBK55_04090 [Alphaproteobacteria bacterium]
MTRLRSRLLITVLGGALLFAAGYGMAQDAPESLEPVPMGISSPAVTGETPPLENIPADPAAAPTEAAAATPETGEQAIDPNQMPSLLFTYWEHTAIVDAKKSVGETREVTEEEWRNIGEGGQAAKPPPEERDITLGGIVFVKHGDWTIWLNGKRVTPDAIPHEVTDLKVFKEHIEMKWFDDYTNQIFPIRLRPHQRFNIDTRIFLPG